MLRCCDVEICFFFLSTFLIILFAYFTFLFYLLQSLYRIVYSSYARLHKYGFGCFGEQSERQTLEELSVLGFCEQHDVAMSLLVSVCYEV